MTLDLVRLLIDFGFVILIWSVQLVIYPSFGFYSKENLFIWHKSYSLRVTYIVFPLMVCQLLLSIVHLWQIQNWYTILSLAIILTLWLLTFLIFVPLHQSIDKGNPVEQVCYKLLKKNWMRTLLWTLLFVISIINFCSI